MKKELFTIFLIVTIILAGCSTRPSDKEIESWIKLHALGCKWKIEGRAYTGFALLYEVQNINWIAEDKAARFLLKLSASPMYPYTIYEPKPLGTYSFSGKWRFKKADSGNWIVDEDQQSYSLE